MERFKVKLDTVNAEFYSINEPIEAVGAIGQYNNWIVCLIPNNKNFGFSQKEFNKDFNYTYYLLEFKKFKPEITASEYLQYKLFAFNRYDFEDVPF